MQKNIDVPIRCITWVAGSENMLRLAQGDINEKIAIAGNPVYPAYVIKGSEKCLMIDAGVNLMGPQYMETLRGILGDHSRLNYLFLTHSHYDHLGAMPYLMRKIPGLRAGGAPSITELLKKESVLSRMKALSDIQMPVFRDSVGDEDVSFTPVTMDPELREGMSFDLGGITCEVYEVPGHTRDSLAFFIPEMRALFPGEAAGVPMGRDGAGTHPQFLCSFDDYVASMRKLVKLKPKIIGIGHGFVVIDDNALIYLEGSIRATWEYRKLIEFYLREGKGDLERAVETMARKEYDEKGNIYQERNAYLVNLAAQVKEIARLNKLGN